MKEKFSKLLLGEDVTGGCKGVATALALSNAITNLAASIFRELWKLKPLSKDMKSRWRSEVNWFISPANYLVELVPTKQNDTNGRSLEIMTAKARSKINDNLPALQKLDSMLIDTLECSFSNTNNKSQIMPRMFFLPVSIPIPSPPPPPRAISTFFNPPDNL